MDCKLCGLPTPVRPPTDNGHAFCCNGCRAVYRCFGEDAIVAGATEKAAAPLLSPIEGNEAFLMIDGMHCSSCEILIERMAQKVSGILSVASSYATSTVKVVYDPERIEESELPKALSLTGYHARLRTDNAPEYDNRQSLLRLFVGVSLAFLVMMLYLAFFYPTNLGLVKAEDLAPVSWLAYYAAPRAMLVLTTILVFYVGAPILRGAWVGLRVRSLNMDNLLAIAILATYGYSIGQLVIGSLDLYFDVASVIVAVVTTGRYFEQNEKIRATRELTNIIEAWTPTARVRINGELHDKTIDELEPGDHLVIQEGEPVPVDGTVISGQAAINESLMTGEPFPVTHGPGGKVLGGTVVVEGTLEIEVGSTVESQIDNLARILWNVQSSAAGVQGMADRIARIFVPVVLVLAVVVTVWALLGGSQPGAALLAGLATLIVSCPCTFGLAIPLTTAVAVSTALRHGIFITSAGTFTKAPHINIVAIDKTGTLSRGEMTVVKVLGPHEVAASAAAVECLSSHPIAEAIARLDSQQAATDLDIHPGKGAVATVANRRVAVGSKSLFAMLGWEIPDQLTTSATATLPEDGVVSYVGWDGCTHGAIITRDQQRPGWEHVVDRLREKYRVVLLTGAEHPCGYEDRVDEVFAGVPPGAKAAVIRQLKTEGTVVMIGDGSNDAPSLAAADLGIAFGSPTALAADAADVVIPGERLERIFDAFELINITRRRVRQNIGWALLYNAIAIPLAITGFLNPLFAALAMSASSLLVVWNSSRPIGSADWISPPIEIPRTRHQVLSRLRSST